MSIAKALIIGNLTQDPELHQLPSGDFKASGSVAVNRKFKKQDGTPGESSTFIDFEIWGTRAKPFAEYHNKGDRCFLEGEIRMDRWEDKSTGARRSKLLVAVLNWEFVKGDLAQASGTESGEFHVEPSPAAKASGYDGFGPDDSPF